MWFGLFGRWFTVLICSDNMHGIKDMALNYSELVGLWYHNFLLHPLYILALFSFSSSFVLVRAVTELWWFCSAWEASRCCPIKNIWEKKTFLGVSINLGSIHTSQIVSVYILITQHVCFQLFISLILPLFCRHLWNTSYVYFYLSISAPNCLFWAFS